MDLRCTMDGINKACLNAGESVHSVCQNEGEDDNGDLFVKHTA